MSGADSSAVAQSSADHSLTTDLGGISGPSSTSSKPRYGKIPTLLWRTGVWPALFADAFVEDTQLEGAASSRWSLLAYASALRELLRDEALSCFAGLPGDDPASYRLRGHVSAIADALEACAVTSCSRERDEVLEEDPDRANAEVRNPRYDSRMAADGGDADGEC